MDIFIRLYNTVTDKYVMDGIPLNLDTIFFGGKIFDKHNIPIQDFDKLEIEFSIPVLDKKGKRIFVNDIVEVTDHTIKETFPTENDKFVKKLYKRVYKVIWDEYRFAIKLLDGYSEFNRPIIFNLPLTNVTYEVIGNAREGKKFEQLKDTY